MEVPMGIWEECYTRCKNPDGALYLYFVLKRLEHIYTNDTRDYFYRTDEELAKDAHISLSSLKRYKKDLLQTNLVQTYLSHFRLSDGRLSEKRVTIYRLA